MKAVLLAAGRGTRLAPLTDSTPKILAPLGGRPLLAHQLDYLARSGVTEVALNVSHHADQVTKFVEEHGEGLVRRISVEPELLGTAGALRPLADFLTAPFVVLYGDVVTTAGLRELMDAHRRSGAIATLAYYESNDAEGKGVLSLAADGRVEAFVEKPRGLRGSAKINAGVYALDPRILDFVAPEPCDFGHDVWPAVIAAGERVHAHRLDGYLRDIGDPEALAAAEADLAAGRLRW